MPALPADIGPALRDAAVETWTNAAMAARYPNARDGSVEPAEGWFDATASAQAALAQRGALLGVERRRFAVQHQGVIWVDPATGVPTITLVDAEQAVNGPALPMRLELNLNTETMSWELFV